MSTTIKTRIEFYIPFVSHPEYQKLYDRLIKLFCRCYGGCTIIDKVDGFYKIKNIKDIWPDIINIFIVDVPSGTKEQSLSYFRLIRVLTKFLADKLDQQSIYFSINGIIFPDDDDEE